jgi:hypothetical protein
LHERSGNPARFESENPVPRINRVLNLSSSEHAPAQSGGDVRRKSEKRDDSLLRLGASSSDVNDERCFAVKNAQRSISCCFDGSAEQG